MRLHECEPPMGPGEVVPVTRLVHDLLDRSRSTIGPFLLAVDGRSANGKSTLASAIAGVVANAAVVHTDDIAWGYSVLGWDHLLLNEVIEPLRRGEAVAYRPKAWETHDRHVEVTVPADAPLAVIEGVGAGRAGIAAHVDAVIWVQSDLDITDARESARVEAGETDPANYDAWMAEEIPFHAHERTWARADAIVCGTADAPEGHVVVSRVG